MRPYCAPVSFCLLLLIVAVEACGARELTPEQKAEVELLRGELTSAESEIAEAEQLDEQLTGGLVKALLAARLEVLKTNRALIDQRILALEGGAKLTIEVATLEPDPAEAERLAAEITVQEEKVELAKQEADLYSGGLIKAMKLSTVATHEQTLAMLRQRYLVAKYGLPAPGLTPTAGKGEAPETQARSATGGTGPPSKLPAEEGPFGFRMGLSKDEIESMIGGSLKSIDGASFLYSSLTVPRPHTAFEAYAMLIGPSSGLCQIRAIGVDIPSSSHGLQIRSAFDDLEATLGGVYGRFKRIDRLLPGSIWGEPEDWMMGLLKQERLLQTEWSAEHGSTLKYNLESVILVAKAKSTDQGYLLLQYSFANNPDCQKEIEQAEKEVL
jgi:hypothetical protein